VPALWAWPPRPTTSFKDQLPVEEHGYLIEKSEQRIWILR
jgi:hypothetical protein